MNYYKHHLGDYAAATRHLSLLEHGVYRCLIDLYYINESPLPVELRAVCRLVCARSDEEREAVKMVLEEFFTLAEDGWHSARCDAEIENAKAKSARNTEIGKLGGRPKKTETVSKETETVLMHEETLSENNPSHKPIANSHVSTDVDTKGAKRRFDAAELELPECVPAEYWRQWIAYRRERKIKTTESTARAQLANLEGWFADGHDPAAIIRHSISNGWQGLFEPKPFALARASPRQTVHEQREAVSMALTGRNRTNERTFDNSERDITGEAVRIA